MSTCRASFLWLAAGAIVAALGAASACKSGACLRVSDCNTGLQCVDGTCVEIPVDAGTDAAVDAARDAASDAHHDAAPADGTAPDAGPRDGAAHDGPDGSDAKGADAAKADGAESHDGALDSDIGDATQG